MPPRDKNDVIREYIIKPLLKKKKYGKAAQGIILLIQAPIEPPWIERIIELQNQFGYNKILKKLYFDEIYLVCPSKNIPIYP